MSDEMTAQSDTPYANAVRGMLPHLEDMVGEPQTPWPSKRGEYALMAAKAAQVRQLSALRATLLLTGAGLGHHGVAHIRPACDELLWLGYLATLTPDQTDSLMILAANHDMQRSVLASKTELGRETMLQQGFSPDLVDGVERRIPMLEGHIKDLGKELGWPKGKGMPSSKWVAGAGGMAAVYDHLHSASSRPLHFSVGEILRRGWGDLGGSYARLDDPHHQRYLSDLALDQQLLLLMRTCDVARHWFVEEGFDDEQFADYKVAMDAWIKLARVPIVLPEEFGPKEPQTGDTP
jgi:hypothetical protein